MRLSASFVVAACCCFGLICLVNGHGFKGVPSEVDACVPLGLCFSDYNITDCYRIRSSMHMKLHVVFFCVCACACSSCRWWWRRTIFVYGKGTLCFVVLFFFISGNTQPQDFLHSFHSFHPLCRPSFNSFVHFFLSIRLRYFCFNELNFERKSSDNMHMCTQPSVPRVWCCVSVCFS
jgi:hypothetical protein